MSKKEAVEIPVKIDEDGYLKNHKDWTPEIMELLAKKEGISLTKEHLWVVNFIRDYYEKYQIYPLMRTIISQLKRQPDLKTIDCVSDFYHLFPGGLGMTCRIAGLPRPS